MRVTGLILQIIKKCGSSPKELMIFKGLVRLWRIQGVKGLYASGVFE
jgi:hypothetical protein